ncbi:NADH-quinone oxidoreductase subunit N [Pseudochryseolinea flava]|uniref:NADH-quinone oxidoreductase subunit N n=1 Tax=Pseudochryseolinea flava TaxID=2059302 RepID=A0A364XZR8_9BACT|nr:NADH-quinone oxidoreductase subunit N [Pseudochryseolinea flava]RAV99817.1 NADH-quinone oxidoreductase subunit N [Pseudochryseolinea flava]
MESSVALSLQDIITGLRVFTPELMLGGGVVLLLIIGLFTNDIHKISAVALLVLMAVAYAQYLRDIPLTSEISHELFSKMIVVSNFSSYMGFLLDLGGILTVLMSWPYFLHADKLKEGLEQRRRFVSEYYLLIVVIVLGGHLLISSVNLLMVFLSLELISLPSYALAGFLFNKKSSEGSFKYFLFGAVASAVMLYGFSLFYGQFGTLDFRRDDLFATVPWSPLLVVSVVFSMAGFLYKIAAVPMHPWAPDVYEAAPTPIVAFFSVVPKLAGLAILVRFVIVSPYDNGNPAVMHALALISILTITVGNFSALVQKNPKRMMAYSSIAQSGFLLVGLVALSASGLQFMIFYSTIYLLMNFLVFYYLQYFELRGFTTIASYQNAGSKYLWPSIFLLVGFISLTGLPPTGGFTAKLFIFSALWESYSNHAHRGDQILLWLFIFGLLNTVVSLFYYLRIPYFAFIKNWESTPKTNILTSSPVAYDSFIGRSSIGNLLGLILVIVLLLIFFAPGLLMGWINKINFVL